MRTSRRRLIVLASAAAAMLALPAISNAQSYPTRPVRLVVGFPPGGVADLYARLIAQALSDRLGQQVVVDNRTGAGGNIATESVIRSAPDGYTLLLAGANDGWNGALYGNLSFDFVRETAPIARIASFAGALVAQPSFPYRTVNDLIGFAKANPGKITMASGGVGSASHIFWELLKTMASVDMVHVPYRGEGPALLDMLGGQVQVMMPTLPPAMEYLKVDKLRPLAVTAASRLEMLPDVPALSEFFPGYEAAGWVGVVAPKGTSVEIVERLNREINAALADRKIKARIAEQGGVVVECSPAEFSNFIVSFNDKWSKVIHAANIKIE